MKTLSQHRQEVKEQREREREIHMRPYRALLDSLKDREIPLYVNQDLRETGLGPFRIAEIRDSVRGRIARGNGELTQVACDHCGTELLATEDHGRSKRVECAGCGFVSYIQA